MLITRLRLKNWRNFREVDVRLGPRGYVIGANASGKSNLMDVFRFLRTLAQTEGGGLQKAIKERGGLGKLRSLHARRDPEVRIEVELADSVDAQVPTWRYALAFKSEGKGQQRVLITEEAVDHQGQAVLRRPGDDDLGDTDRRTQTHLEQINNNARFRAVVDCFGATTYLHLVPQLLKHSGEIGARVLENDPFGQGLLQRIAKTPKKTRDARMARIAKALAQAVPLFSELRFEQEPISGLWHLEANFTHWRVNGAWQREDQFSDGTLRLIALLWALQEGAGLLLLEEPELSLNDGIVEHIPLMVDRVLRLARMMSRQVLISTHSEVLLSQVTDARTVLLIEPGANGSTVRSPVADEVLAVENGLNAAEVLLPKTRATGLDQLGLFT
ncbi:putative ATPase [Sphaerotilus hippei]|uniref:Putative ATPase n=1 Tax=Sphaerotilus hippei TaxID=744406 RepID=A0A318H6R6_9BURK|nr:ATP-binding protein [Sphaerotilus hippei]PXW99575.1 putative ATPase [Sphaerotilus hippei]